MPGNDKVLKQGWETIFIEKLSNNRMEVVLSVTITKSGETNITVFREKEKAEKDDSINAADKKPKTTTKEPEKDGSNGITTPPSDPPQGKTLLNATRKVSVKKIANKKVATKKVTTKK
jgi:hypothetical protein